MSQSSQEALAIARDRIELLLPLCFHACPYPFGLLFAGWTPDAAAFAQRKI
jgi:hypothetical protein